MALKKQHKTEKNNLTTTNDLTTVFETATVISTIENTVVKYCQGHVLPSQQNDQLWNSSYSDKSLTKRTCYNVDATITKWRSARDWKDAEY